jgi:3-dehydroquinate synthetase
MKKVNIFLVTVSIIVLTIICFTGMAVAAQISWVNESKGRVHINGGITDGYIVGATVCFIISSGETLACGTVQSAEASSAVVIVDKNSAKRMKKGTEALLYVEKEDKEESKETSKETQDKESQGKETSEENVPSPSMRIHDQKGY